MGNIFPLMEQSRRAQALAAPVMDLEPNDLLLFAKVVDAGSFSRAAERLRLPKSTVSRRVALLEAQLGERLLLRTTGPISRGQGSSLKPPTRGRR